METLAGYITQVQAVEDAGGGRELSLPRLNDEVRRIELRKFVKFEPTVAEPEPETHPPEPGPPAVESIRLGPKLEPGGALDYWFYLSYAPPDSGVYLQRFYSDLGRQISLFAEISDSSERIGFFNSKNVIRGAFWPEEVANALTTARILVPIISPVYILNEYCGKEWQIFIERAQLANSGPYPILPVIWMPVHRDLPPAISHVQLWSADFPDAYRENGLLSLMRRRRNQEHYKEFLHRFAEKLVARARDVPAPPAKQLPAFESVASAFAPQSEHASSSLTPRAVRIVLVVGTRAEMASVRMDTFAYGDDPGDWTPYNGSDSVAATAREAAASQSRYASIAASPLDLEALRKSIQACIVIIDPWALKLDRIRRELSALNQEARLNSIICVFDGAAETHDNGGGALRKLLASTMPNIYGVSPEKCQEAHTHSQLTSALVYSMDYLTLELIRGAPVSFPPELRPPKIQNV